jgi:hypothetical protein
MRAVAAWRDTVRSGGPGRPKVYANAAIECALILKSVFHLSLRATQGVLGVDRDAHEARTPRARLHHHKPAAGGVGHKPATGASFRRSKRRRRFHG